MAKDASKKEKKEKKQTRASKAVEAEAEAMDIDSKVADVETKTKEPKEPKEPKESKDKDFKYEERLSALAPVAHPLASKKLTKKIYKSVRKAAKSKSLRRGVKEVVKSLRKGAKGFVVLAGDISPIDVLTHLPVLCEEANVPYVYIPSKEDLGTAGSTKRPTSCILVVEEKLKDKLDKDDKQMLVEILEELKTLNEKMITTIA